MKVLFSTDQIYLHGGIEKTMAEKANYFADVLGYEVYIMTTQQKLHKPCYPLSDSIKCVDLNINYNRSKSYFHVTNLRLVFKHFLQSKRAIKQMQPDFIVVCNFAFDFYWMPFISSKIITVKEFHSSRYFSWQQRKAAGVFGKISNWFTDYTESKYDQLLVLNNDEKAFFKSSNVQVIPNAIVIPQATAALKNKRAIAAGRIAPVKGFDKLISIWSVIHRDLPDWHLHIYGQGEAAYIELLNTQIKLQGLEKIVHINPATSCLQAEMLEASLYVMTSKTECYPMVLLEALSVGLPVVSYDCPTGPRNIIKHLYSGILIPNQDEAAFAKEVVILAQNQPLLQQMGAQAKIASKAFSVEAVMQKWVAFFNTI
jgi:glycosyltransferase involved in cell wall biosynthesis